MLTRRQALMGTAAAAMLPTLARAAAPHVKEADIAGLPREKVTLVAPPFVHAHQQVAKTGPKVVEFVLPIEEKPVVIDDEGTVLQGMTFNGSIPGPMMVVHEGDYVEVTLVNRDNFFLFTPMLHEVAASDLDLTNIVCPVRKMLRRVDFFAGDVDAIDLGAKKVTLRHGSDDHTHEVEYDTLVVTLGSTTNFFGLPGLEERALTMKSLGDAIHLRNRLIAHLEQGDSECAVASRESLLTFVVAGGGFAGVETVASMNDFLREALAHYPHLTNQNVRVVLVHPGEYILPELGEPQDGLGHPAREHVEGDEPAHGHGAADHLERTEP